MTFIPNQSTELEDETNSDKEERLRLLKQCAKLYDIANEICFCDFQGYPFSADGETIEGVDFSEDDENQCADSEKTFEKALHETLQRSCFNEIFHHLSHQSNIPEIENKKMTRKNRFVKILRSMLYELEIERVRSVENLDIFIKNLESRLFVSTENELEWTLSKSVLEKHFLVTNHLNDINR